MASKTDNYLDIVDNEIPLFAFTTTAALVPPFTVPSQSSSYVLAMSSSTPFYVRKGNASVVATTASLRIPANTMYHLSYSGERVSILGDGAGGNVSITLMK